MLVRFSSVATESLIMFGDDGVRLIRMMGASGVLPGAISAEDVPAALARLRQQLQAAAPQDQEPASSQQDGEEAHEPQIALAARAGPLIDLLERAGAGNAPMMWEQV